ncbi:MAG: hypothetical protein PQJ48_03825 [Sphaerochaetaceae bacterium]|nr:hypothetical protein [Sphaerochaetaceae bacterium]
MNKKLILTLTLLSFSALSLFAFSFTPFVETEQGTIGLLHHTFQNGAAGDEFDFIKQGGQNNLYPFSRYTVGARIEDKHRLWFTYQPLQLDTAVDFKDNNVKIGGHTFNGPMELTYSFPFYRATYTYDLLGKYEEAYLGVGLALQIRNASIQFREMYDDGTDTAEYFVSQNVGLVPALAIYSEYRFPFGLTLSADIAGSYANLAYINGADYAFEGSILDASLRMDYAIEDGFSLFANARFFGGTADGESENDASNWTESTEAYTKNNIASLTFSAGLAWQMQ